jgi:signal transduction histidine kinase
MSASVASVAKASPSSPSTPTRDPPRLQILVGALAALFVVVLLRAGESLVATLLTEWKSLLFWAALVVLLSLFPIAIEDATLTLDEPFLLAIALLYPPEAAAIVAFCAAIDVREIRRQTVFSRALYNRVQIGLCVYLAGLAFRFVTNGQLDPWTIAILGTLGAVVAEYLANVILVSVHARVRWRVGFQEAARRLKVGNMGQFLATHLGYACLALVVAQMFRGVGAWSVTMFLVPILVARQMLIRGQTIEALAEQVRKRDQLLKRVSDRILDERRDERRRVAGDLHDGILQGLTEISLLSRLIEKEGACTGRGLEDVGKLVRSSQASIESLRTVIRGLRESPLGGSDLVSTIDGLVRNARLDWRAKIKLELPTRLEIPADLQVVVYQVARESLMNALKHAEASTIWIRLLQEVGELVLEVEDNGVGFQPELVGSLEHFGLELLQERAHAVGGYVEIHSELSRGTKVRAIFPAQNS